jgi:aconitate decarboxylase
MGAPSDAGYTKALASFVASLGWDALPPEVVSRAKLLVLDGLGCGLFGASQPWSHILVRTLETIDGANHTSGVWGRDVRLSVPHAALANATAVQGFELDDVHVPGILHCESLTIPAALALSESRGSVSGRDLLTSIVAGFEAGSRAGMCMRGREMLMRGWHSGSIVGGFAAASTTANLLGLDATATEHALGIAGSGASGLMAAQYGAMVKRMQHGRACQTGVYAGLLAEAGFTGIEDVFEVPYGGFCTTFTQSADAFDLGALTAGLGSEFETKRIRVKLYPCMAGCHAPVHTALLLKQREGFSTDDILRIELTGAKPFVEHGGWPYAGKTVTEAQMNIPYSVAAALHDDELTVTRFTESVIRDAEVLDLASRITVGLDSSAPVQGGGEHITIVLNSGRRVAQYLEPSKGVGSDPEQFPEAEVIEKFRDLAGRVRPEAVWREIERVLLELEHQDDVGGLCRLLNGG